MKCSKICNQCTKCLKYTSCGMKKLMSETGKGELC